MKNNKIFRLLVLLLTVLTAISVQDVLAGWSVQQRNNCKIFPKYKAKIHTGYTTSGGGSIGYTSDHGCGYAIAGPAKLYTLGSPTIPPLLLAEAKASVGSVGLSGYANSWNRWDAIAGLMKYGKAGEISDIQDIPITDTSRRLINNLHTGSNFVFIAPVEFIFREPIHGASYITVPVIMGHFVAESGYSTFEIIVWKPEDSFINKIEDTEITTRKILWRGRAIVHNNALRVEGNFSRDMFTSSDPNILRNIFTPGAPNRINNEIIYSLRNVNIKIPLPLGTDLDSVAITIKGDAGDESVTRTTY